MESQSSTKVPVTIYVESTPNPASLKFVANRALNPAPSILYTDLASAKSSPLALALFKFPFIKNIFIAANFITITKIDAIEWQDVMHALRDFLTTYLNGDEPIFNKETPPVIHVDGRVNIAAQEAPKPFTDIETKIAGILDEYIKPAVESDGGAISLKSFNEGIVTVIMQGSCSGCPSSTYTLKAGIEGLLKRLVPEVESVVAEEA